MAQPHPSPPGVWSGDIPSSRNSRLLLLSGLPSDADRKGYGPAETAVLCARESSCVPNEQRTRWVFPAIAATADLTLTRWIAVVGYAFLGRVIARATKAVVRQRARVSDRNGTAAVAAHVLAGSPIHTDLASAVRCRSRADK
jgi:hypothetical protein